MLRIQVWIVYELEKKNGFGCGALRLRKGVRCQCARQDESRRRSVVTVPDRQLFDERLLYQCYVGIWRTALRLHDHEMGVR